MGGKFMASRQLLIFKLNGDNYGVEITHIDSIVATKEIVKVPNTPDYIEGLMSLRGKIYTIFSLRKRFALPHHEFDENTKIVIVNINSVTVGFIVDEVNEITRFEDENIESTPQAISALNRKFISGVAKMGEKLVIMLDLEQILSFREDAVKV
jgi:purine-binding chemotaxis protein CheW